MIEATTGVVTPFLLNAVLKAFRRLKGENSVGFDLTKISLLGLLGLVDFVLTVFGDGLAFLVLFLVIVVYSWVVGLVPVVLLVLVVVLIDGELATFAYVAF